MPIFLHNDDRIEALVSVVGLALLVFGLIECELRRQLDHEKLPGLLPEGRSGPPTARSILAAFQGLGLTHTAEGSSSIGSLPPSGAFSSCCRSRSPGRSNDR